MPEAFVADPDSLWRSAEFHRGTDLKFPAEITIPTLTGQMKIWAIIETFENKPTFIKYTVPLSPMPVDPISYSYTRAFNQFSRLNQKTIELDTMDLTLPNILAILNITDTRLGGLKINPSIKEKGSAVSFELSGRAVSCAEVFMPSLPYIPTERAKMFTERLNRLGWEVTLLDSREFYIQEL